MMKARQGGLWKVMGKQELVKDWEKARALIQKLVDARYITIAYGEIVSAVRYVSYPLSQEETEFLINYFKRNEDKVWQ